MIYEVEIVVWSVFALSAIIAGLISCNEPESLIQSASEPEKTILASGDIVKLTSEDLLVETFTPQRQGSGLLDILLVIDDSESMEEEQIGLASRLSDLLKYIEDSDWQIRIITTDDDDDNCLRTPPITAENKEIFQSIVNNLGTDGSGKEHAVQMAIRGLQGKCDETTTPWLRENSVIAILIVTDEDHRDSCEEKSYKKMFFAGFSRSSGNYRQ